MGDAQQLGGVGQIYLALMARNTLEPELQVGPYREVRKQARLLKDVAQCAFVHRDKVISLAVLPDFIVDLHIGLGSAFKTGNAA